MRARGREPKRNLAARAGRWSARHRKAAIWGWVGFVVLALALGGALGTKTLKDSESQVGESGRAERTLEGAFPTAAEETVLVQARLGRDAGSLRAGVAEVEERLGKLAFVHDLQGPYAAGNEGQLSADGRSALVQFRIPENERVEPTEKVAGALAAVAAAQKRHPDLRIEEVGSASAEKAISKSLGDDFSKAEITSLPITLLILVIVFGALVAAGVPLLLALTAVAATIGLLGPISHVFGPVAEQISSVVLLIGLAVGVDYTMFYLRREREERAAGRGERASLEAAAATSGRAVLVSGFTVMVAMAGMYIAGDKVFASFATGTILVVAVAMVGSLTVLPAILAWLGDRVEKGHVPLVGRLKSGGEGSRVWSALIDRVLRRPLLAGGLALGALVVLAIPAFGLRTSNTGVDGLPKDLPIVRTYDRVEAAFPGGEEPAQVVVKAADVTAPPVAGAIRELRREALADSGSFGSPISQRVSADRTVAELQVPLAGDGTDARSNAALEELRGKLVPAAFAAAPQAEVAVGGNTASSKDFNDLLSERVPWVFAFVLGAAFLLLLVSFRSLVIPVTAIGLNLLSVGAAYGIVVWIFQEGHLEGLLGFQSSGAITSWLPLFLFVVLFGLSMDYHVFILTRIREAYDRGMPTDEAIAHGLKTTAGVVTSAAAVMVAVFAIFATLSFLDFKQMGIGLAAAILIDATVIRGVLLPATMKLLGERNWYLPRWLQWLPRLGEGAATPGRGEFLGHTPSNAPQEAGG
ncbi:MAG TPA: MMPL family transporter [Solirubrobacterales bacterium]|nr:MMPL family transporter [Solirubrobacterales bacterium]